jgi:hypothetical protein
VSGAARTTNCAPSKPVDAGSAVFEPVIARRTPGAAIARPSPGRPTVSIFRSVPKPWPGAAAMKLTVAGRLASPSSTRWDSHATSMRPVASIAAWRGRRPRGVGGGAGGRGGEERPGERERREQRSAGRCDTPRGAGAGEGRSCAAKPGGVVGRTTTQAPTTGGAAVPGRTCGGSITRKANGIATS